MLREFLSKAFLWNKVDEYGKMMDNMDGQMSGFEVVLNTMPKVNGMKKIEGMKNSLNSDYAMVNRIRQQWSADSHSREKFFVWWTSVWGTSAIALLGFVAGSTILHLY